MNKHRLRMRSFAYVVLVLIALAATIAAPHHHAREPGSTCAQCECSQGLEPVSFDGVEPPIQQAIYLERSECSSGSARISLLDAPKQGPPGA